MILPGEPRATHAETDLRRRSSTFASRTTLGLHGSLGTSGATTTSASRRVVSTTCSRGTASTACLRVVTGAPCRACATRRGCRVINVQVDVKFLHPVDSDGRRVRRSQYTAIDDATRIRAPRIHEKHTQAVAIDFSDHVVRRVPFRIHTMRTDSGHELQTKFHWHSEDQGMSHVYIKPTSPNLEGKVERSHLTDQLEFSQLLDYTGDVDLRAKLAVWEEFYNLQRPHTAHSGRTPYEVLREKLVS